MPKDDVAQIYFNALKGRHPRVHRLDIHAEPLDFSIFVVICDAAKSVSITHGKNGVPELPAIKK